MTELLSYLMAAAVSLSGLPPVPRPQTVALSSQTLVQRVCPTDPANCRQLAAVYETETNTVFYDFALDLEDDADNSFIVHEYVHALQHAAAGDKIYESCENLLETERMAYSVQNEYLKRRGQLRRVGEALRYVRCPEQT